MQLQNVMIEILYVCSSDILSNTFPSLTDIQVCAQTYTNFQSETVLIPQKITFLFISKFNNADLLIKSVYSIPQPNNVPLPLSTLFQRICSSLRFCETFHDMLTSYWEQSQSEEPYTVSLCTTAYSKFLQVSSMTCCNLRACHDVVRSNAVLRQLPHHAIPSLCTQHLPLSHHRSHKTPVGTEAFLCLVPPLLYERTTCLKT